jgi:DNA-binding NtrC family response regulator
MTKASGAVDRADRILVIEDDPGVTATIRLLLETRHFQPTLAATANAGIRFALAGGFDLIVTDLRLPDSNGIEVIRSVKTADPDATIILMTAYSTVENAVQALREGAVDYIIKPFDNDEFLHTVERALNERRIRRENAALKRKLKKAYSIDNIIGESEEVRKVLALIRRVAPADANVLIQGESGTGKELVAQAIHYASPRADGPFVPLNCGAIPWTCWSRSSSAT